MWAASYGYQDIVGLLLAHPSMDVNIAADVSVLERMCVVFVNCYAFSVVAVSDSLSYYLQVFCFSLFHKILCCYCTHLPFLFE
jgi:hypothetical protein